MKTFLLFLFLIGSVFASEQQPARDDSFVFEVSGRRDPFSFTREIPQIQSVSPGGEVATETKIDPAKIAQKRFEALTQYSLAENLFTEDNFIDALRHCDTGLEVFKDIPMRDYRELQEIRDSLIRLRKASERLKQRGDVEREFSLMNVKLTGVVSRAKNSEAIVNQKIVRRGDFIPTPEQNVIVTEILPEHVVFTYKEYRIVMTLDK